MKYGDPDALRWIQSPVDWERWVRRSEETDKCWRVLEFELKQSSEYLTTLSRRYQAKAEHQIKVAQKRKEVEESYWYESAAEGQ